MLLTLAPAVLLALAGCGGGTSTPSAAPSATVSRSAASSPGPSDPFEGRSAREILALAAQAFDAAGTVHVVGSDSDGTLVGMDIRTSSIGDAVAELDLGDDGVVEIRIIGGDVWLSGDTDFWELFGPAQIRRDVPADRLEGRWVRTTTSAPEISAFLQVVSKTFWAGNLDDPQGELEVVTGKEIDGVPTVGLKVSGEEPSTLYVAARGPAYPLAIEPESGEGGLRFTDWDAPVDVEEPPAKDVVEP